MRTQRTCPFYLNVVELEAWHGEVVLVYEHRAVLLSRHRDQDVPGPLAGKPGVVPSVHLAHAQGRGKGVITPCKYGLYL